MFLKEWQEPKDACGGVRNPVDAILALLKAILDGPIVFR